MGGMKLQTVRSYSSACVGVLVALSAVLAGCRPSDDGRKDELIRFRQDAEAVFPRPNPGPRPGKRTLPLVRLGVTVVAFPAGTLTGGEAVWAKLKYKPWLPDVRALQSLNGLRVGILKTGAWPALAKTFEQLKGFRIKSAKLPAHRTSPVQVFLQRYNYHRTVFSYRLDETMFGMDYPPGDALMAVQCVVEAAMPSRMTMTVMPQVQASRQKMHYTKTNGRYSMIKRPILHNFAELAWQISATTDDIVVIGPGRGSQRSSSVGRMFFFRDLDGVTFETLLLLSPTVTMVGGPGGPMPPPKPKPTSRPTGEKDKSRPPIPPDKQVR